MPGETLSTSEPLPDRSGAESGSEPSGLDPSDAVQPDAAQPDAAQPDAPVTVQLTIVRADPIEDEPGDDEPGEDEPQTLSGVIAHHLDELRTREADGEVLDLVTYELRRLTGRRNVRALRGRHSA